ncbi:unnamed protein product [Boreogadus saida]
MPRRQKITMKMERLEILKSSISVQFELERTRSTKKVSTKGKKLFNRLQKFPEHSPAFLLPPSFPSTAGSGVLVTVSARVSVPPHTDRLGFNCPGGAGSPGQLFDCMDTPTAPEARGAPGNPARHRLINLTWQPRKILTGDKSGRRREARQWGFSGRPESVLPFQVDSYQISKQT